MSNASRSILARKTKQDVTHSFSDVTSSNFGWQISIINDIVYQQCDLLSLEYMVTMATKEKALPVIGPLVCQQKYSPSFYPTRL
jgi:hypothetical protein